MEVQIQHGCWERSPDFPPTAATSALSATETSSSSPARPEWLVKDSHMYILLLRCCHLTPPSLIKWNMLRVSGVFQISIVKLSAAVASHIPRRLRLEPELRDFRLLLGATSHRLFIYSEGATLSVSPQRTFNERRFVDAKTPVMVFITASAGATDMDHFFSADWKMLCRKGKCAA